MSKLPQLAPYFTTIHAQNVPLGGDLRHYIWWNIADFEKVIAPRYHSDLVARFNPTGRLCFGHGRRAGVEAHGDCIRVQIHADAVDKAPDEVPFRGVASRGEALIMLSVPVEYCFGFLELVQPLRGRRIQR